MNLITNPEFLNIGVLSQFLFAITRLNCPFCYQIARNKNKLRTYNSLWGLVHHVGVDHKDNGIHPCSKEQFQELVKVIAFAMQVGMLPCKHASIFPRVMRLEDDNT